MLKVEFGTFGNLNIGNDPNYTPNQPHNYTKPKLPYLILYNKYSGIMRFFGSLLDANSDYETLEIILSVPSESPLPSTFGDYFEQLKVTNLLSIQGETVQPLDQETEENFISIFVNFRNNENEFFWFDLPVAYDPCICNNKVQLDVFFNFVQAAQIAINGDTTKGIYTATKQTASGSMNYGKMVFSRVLAAGISGAVAIKTGGAVVNFKAFTDLIDIVKDHPNRSQEERDNLTTIKNYLNCASTFAQAIKGNYADVTDTTLKKAYAAGQKILDANTTFLTSFANGCREKDNAATTITTALTASGTWTRDVTIGGTNIHLALPGSNWGDEDLLHIYSLQDSLKPGYPTYNERLGTFALLETPELFISELKAVTIPNPTVPIMFSANQSLISIEFTDDFLYTFNPKMNLNMDKTQIQCRIVLKENSLYTLNTSNQFILNTVGFDQNLNTHVPLTNILNIPNRNIISVPNSTYPIASRFVPIEQFKNMPIVFSLQSGTYDNFIQEFQNDLLIQFRISCESYDVGTTGLNKSALLYTYPIKFTGREFAHPNGIISGQEEGIMANVEDLVFFLNNTYIPQITDQFATGIMINNGGFEFNTAHLFTSDEVLAFEGLVTISSHLHTNPNTKIKIYSSVGFDLKLGARIGSNIRLIVGSFPFSESPQPPATYEQVALFCSNPNKYKAQNLTTAAIQRERDEYDRRKFEDEKLKKETYLYNKPTIYPNPNSGSFQINFLYELSENATLSVTDVTGRTFLSKKLNSLTKSYNFELSNVNNGIYFVTITQNGHKTTHKMMVHKE